MSGKDESNLIKILRNTPKVIVSQSLFGRFDIHHSQRYKLQTFIEDMKVRSTLMTDCNVLSSLACPCNYL